ncbi:MAG: hypothetical protein IJC24_03365 [Clostridia bacterium]|nr:hypothetical protein [Clostridia bacterium]
MGKYKKELAAAAAQLAVFWLVPLCFSFLRGKGGAIFMVQLMLIGTIALSAILCAGSERRAKYFFPLFAAAMFLPTVPVYYNSTALIHSLWYFIASWIGIGTGLLKKKI